MFLQLGLHSLTSGGASEATNEGAFDRHGRWTNMGAKNGYVMDMVERLLSVSQKLGFRRFSVFSVMTDVSRILYTCEMGVLCANVLRQHSGVLCPYFYVHGLLLFLIVIILVQGNTSVFSLSPVLQINRVIA